MATVVTVVLVGASTWAALVGLLALQEHDLIFFPTRVHAADPSAFGLEAEDLRISAADGTPLHGWWLRGAGDRVLVWYHGNAGNIADRLDNARLFVERLGVNIVLVDYRGYGRSGGTPDEPGLYLDGLAIHDTVTDRGVSPDRIVLFGRSLGSAVAVEVARRRPVGAVVLESAFRSLPAMARDHYWYVPEFVIRTRLDTESKIASIRAPKLFLHGTDDQIVPVAHGHALFARALEPKRLHLIEGATHNDTHLVGGRAYLDVWGEFLRDTD